MFVLKGIQTAAAAIGAAYAFMDIGHDTTAEAVSQNGCIAEDMRVASVNTIITTTNTNDTSQHVGTFTVVLATIAMTELAVMSLIAGGNAASRSKFAVVNLITNDVVVMTVKFVVV